MLSSWETTKAAEVANRESRPSNFSMPSRLSLLQLCYVDGENPSHKLEGLSAPLGVENPPYTFLPGNSLVCGNSLLQSSKPLGLVKQSGGCGVWGVWGDITHYPLPITQSPTPNLSPHNQLVRYLLRQNQS